MTLHSRSETIRTKIILFKVPNNLLKAQKKRRIMTHEIDDNKDDNPMTISVDSIPSPIF